VLRNRTAAATSATLLFLSAVGLLVPAVFDSTHHSAQAAERTLSLEIACVLFGTYMLSLIFAGRIGSSIGWAHGAGAAVAVADGAPAPGRGADGASASVHRAGGSHRIHRLVRESLVRPEGHARPRLHRGLR
jgi:Ca2+/H+ antiporter